MAHDRLFQARAELRQMATANLLKMAFCQKEKRCLLGGVCPFLLEYQGILFCVSEILGQGCQIEKLRLLSEQNAHDDHEISRKAIEQPVGPWLSSLGCAR